MLQLWSLPDDENPLGVIQPQLLRSHFFIRASLTIAKKFPPSVPGKPDGFKNFELSLQADGLLAVYQGGPKEVGVMIEVICTPTISFFDGNVEFSGEDVAKMGLAVYWKVRTRLFAVALADGYWEP